MAETIREMVVRLSMDAGGLTKPPTTSRGRLRILTRKSGRSAVALTRL